MAETNGILSKGIKLSYSATGSDGWNALTDLQEIPEIGNGAREKVETTTLDDDVKKYIAGLGDSGQELAFKFLYKKEQFNTLSAISTTQHWKVEMPDGVNATFQGVPAVKFDGAGTNVALTYTLMITVESKIVFATGA